MIFNTHQQSAKGIISIKDIAYNWNMVSMHLYKQTIMKF